MDRYYSGGSPFFPNEVPRNRSLGGQDEVLLENDRERRPPNPSQFREGLFLGVNKGPKHQTDMDRLQEDPPMRLNPGRFRVWDARWNRTSKGKKVFEVLFSQGTSSHFSQENLREIKQNVKPFLDLVLEIEQHSASGEKGEA